MNEGPRIERVRHELKRRRLTVARVERFPPKMVRVVLAGAELTGFTSLGFDDHVKLMFPSEGEGMTAMRDFTPRRFDADAGELWIDFFLHEGGPAATWAAQAAVGQMLEIGGPKGSAIISMEDIDSHVLVGDETALPAISRRLDELPASGRALVVIEAESEIDRAALVSRAALEVVWIPRNGGGGASAHGIIDALRRLEFPPGRCFIWVACESRAARTIRNYLRDDRGIDKRWLKAAGYWQQGSIGTHDSISEEA